MLLVTFPFPRTDSGTVSPEMTLHVILRNKWRVFSYIVKCFASIYAQTLHLKLAITYIIVYQARPASIIVLRVDQAYPLLMSNVCSTHKSCPAAQYCQWQSEYSNTVKSLNNRHIGSSSVGAFILEVDCKTTTLTLKLEGVVCHKFHIIVTNEHSLEGTKTNNTTTNASV